jgi:hypothetical protein
VNSTSAEVRFGPAGVVKVASHLYPATTTYVDCFAYQDQAPILVIRDGHVEVTITAPDSGRVTAEDLARGRELAEAAARYVAELERHQAVGADPASDPIDSVDRAARAA